MTRLCIGLLAVGAAGLVTAGAGAATATPTTATAVIVGPDGAQQIRPAQLSLASGDAGDIVTGITWVSWNGDDAVGMGTEAVNTCAPSCARGVTVSQPVVVRLSDSRVSPGQATRYFTQATVFRADGGHGVTLK